MLKRDSGPATAGSTVRGPELQDGRQLSAVAAKLCDGALQCSSRPVMVACSRPQTSLKLSLLGCWNRGLLLLQIG